MSKFKEFWKGQSNQPKNQCPDCGGTGLGYDDEGSTNGAKCPTCRGSGVKKTEDTEKSSTFHVGQIVTSDFSEKADEKCKITAVYPNEEYQLKGLTTGESFRAREGDINLA